jgi:hypothetical protein
VRILASSVYFAIAIALISPKAIESQTSGPHYERPTDGRSFKKAVIVFVHGLSGDSAATWKADSGAYWPSMMLKDSAFDSFDIYVAGYPTRLVGSNKTVDEIVNVLNSRLVNFISYAGRSLR